MERHGGLWKTSEAWRQTESWAVSSSVDVCRVPFSRPLWGYSGRGKMRAMRLSGKSMAKTIHLHRVPDGLHSQLKSRAASMGLSLSNFVVGQLRRIAEQPIPEETAERLRHREPYRGKLSPTRVLREQRDAYEARSQHVDED